MKYLLGQQPLAWLDYLGFAGADVELLDQEVEQLEGKAAKRILNLSIGLFAYGKGL